MKVSYSFLAIALLCFTLGALLLLYVYLTDTSHESALLQASKSPYVIDRSLLVDTYAGALLEGVELIGSFVRSTRLKESEVSLGKSLCYDFVSLTPVRDQGVCNSCIPFALTSVLADRVALLSRGKYVVPLSPQQLISCSGETSFWGCDMGSNLQQMLQWCYTHPLIPEKFFTYEQTADPSSSIVCEYNLFNSYRVQVDPENTGRLGWKKSENVSLLDDRHINTIFNMRVALHNDGPLLTLIQLFGTRIEGRVVYDLEHWSSTEIYKEPGPVALEYHAVEIVGYHKPSALDKDFEGAYWVLKNSWGKGWPLDVANTSRGGYFRLAMGSNICGVEQYAMNISPLVELNDVIASLSYGGAAAAQQALFDARSVSLDYLLYAGISEMTLGVFSSIMAVVPLKYAVYVLLSLSVLVGLVPTILYILDTKDLETEYHLSQLADDVLEKVTEQKVTSGTNIVTQSSRFLIQDGNTYTLAFNRPIQQGTTPEVTLSAKHFSYETPLTTYVESNNTQRAVIGISDFETTPLRTLNTGSNSLVFTTEEDTSDTNVIDILCLPNKHYLLATERSLYLVQPDLSGVLLLSSLTDASLKYQHNQLLWHPDGHWLWYHGQTGSCGKVTSSATDNTNKWNGNTVEVKGSYIYTNNIVSNTIDLFTTSDDVTTSAQPNGTNDMYLFLFFVPQRAITLTHVGINVVLDDDISTIEYAIWDLYSNETYASESPTYPAYQLASGSITQANSTQQDTTWFLPLPSPIDFGQRSHYRSGDNINKIKEGLYIVIKIPTLLVEDNDRFRNFPIPFTLTKATMTEPKPHPNEAVLPLASDVLWGSQGAFISTTAWSNHNTNQFTHSLSYGITFKYTLPLAPPFRALALAPGNEYPIVISPYHSNDSSYNRIFIHTAQNTRGSSWTLASSAGPEDYDGWPVLYPTSELAQDGDFERWGRLLETELFMLQQIDGSLYIGSLYNNRCSVASITASFTIDTISSTETIRASDVSHLFFTGRNRVVQTSLGMALVADNAQGDLYIVHVMDMTSETPQALNPPYCSRITQNVRSGWQQFTAVFHVSTQRIHVFYFTNDGYLMYKTSDNPMGLSDIPPAETFDEQGGGWSSVPTNVDSQVTFDTTTRLAASVSTEGRIAVFISTPTNQILLISHTDGTFTPTAVIHAITRFQTL